MTLVPVNLPNTLTLGRIFLVPLLVVVLLTKFDGRELFGVGNEVLGAAIFAIASLTDWLDGFLARRRGQVTGLGQWMDPLADKLLVTGALISLVQLDLAAAWMVAVILGREFAVTVLRSVVHARGYALPASPIGKVKLVAQVVAILALILSTHPGTLADDALWPRHQQNLFVLGQIALWVATIAALISAVDYSRRVNALFGTRSQPVPLAPVDAPAAEPRPAPNRVSA
ncbi:MAG: CDP-diacylglycerol--glycerol-3-phosphate 3-phosphatidyltransferase [Vicinamibacterales bacterium]